MILENNRRILLLKIPSAKKNTKLTHAFILYVKDGLTDTVEVDNIYDFNPSNKEDFEKGKKYKLKSYFVDNSVNETTEDVIDIFILRLGGMFWLLICNKYKLNKNICSIL